MNQLVTRHANAVGALQVEYHPLGLCPGQTIVEPQQGGSEPILEEHVAFAGTFGCQLIGRHIGPTQPLQEPTGRILGVIELIQLDGRGHWNAPIKRCTNGLSWGETLSCQSARYSDIGPVEFGKLRTAFQPLGYASNSGKIW